MATKFDTIYDMFLSQIDDYELSLVGDDVLPHIFKRYLTNSMLTIQEVSPSPIDSINFNESQFNETLSLQMQLLIAKAMKLEWVKEKLYSEELMRKSIGDRDYQAVKGTDYINSLTTLSNNLGAEIRNDLMRFSYLEDNAIEGFMNG